MGYWNKTRYQPYTGNWETTSGGNVDGRGGWAGNYTSHLSVKNGQSVYNWKGGRLVLRDTGSSYLREETRVTVDEGDDIFGSYKRLDIAPFPVRGFHSWGQYGIGAPWTVSQIPSMVSGAVSVAATDFLRDAYRVGTTFNGLTMLAEAREAIAMIRNPLSALRRGFDDYLNTCRKLKRRRGRHGAAALNKAVAGTWLEYSYGWGPLISDIQDAAKAAADRLNYIPQSETVQAAFRDKRTVESGSGFMSDGQGDLRVGFYWNTHEEHEINVLFKGGYSGRNDAAGAPADFGLSLRNVIPTIWEVIPYSFIVDYFTNVGDYLEGMCAGTSNVWYCSQNIKYTAKKRIQKVGDTYKNINDAYPFQLFGFGARCSSYTVERTWFSRTPIIAGNLRPSLRFKAPGLFSKQSLNMAALVAQGRSVERTLQS